MGTFVVENGLITRYADYFDPRPFFAMIEKRASDACEMTPRTVTGDYLGVPFPPTIEMLLEQGTHFLTEAFRAAGSLAADNRVTAIMRTTRSSTAAAWAGSSSCRSSTRGQIRVCTPNCS